MKKFNYFVAAFLLAFGFISFAGINSAFTGITAFAEDNTGSQISNDDHSNVTDDSTSRHSEDDDSGCTNRNATGSVHGGNATLKIPSGACPMVISFSTYSHNGHVRPFEDQILTDNITDTYGPGTYNLGPLKLSCNWQADLYGGPVQEVLNHDYGTANLIAYDRVENQDCHEQPPTDVCPNIDGNQSEVPAGKHKDEAGNCVPNVEVCDYANPPAGYHYEQGPDYNAETNCGMILVHDDVCPNIEGNQSEVPDGYHLSDGQCVPNSPNTATISATKIVCDTETDLPNWGSGGPDVTSTTATTFLASHPNCHAADWTFEWAPNNTANPGDQIGVAGGAWTAFSGSTIVPSGAKVWVREQADADYIPFSGDTTDPRTDDVSAEFYCSNDVLNYDNYDFVNPVESGHTYNCVGFNVPKEIPTLPQCSDNLDNDGDGLKDTLDPGCHSDGNPGNPETYNPTDDNEQNAQCSDGVDNSDAEDTLVDANDPGCHTDGNVNNGDSYNGGDNDESNTPQQCEADGFTSSIYSNQETLYNGGATVIPALIKPNWTASIPGAKWIWSEDPLVDPVNQVSKVFTKDFVITGTPVDSSLEIAADNWYEVSVNGHLIGSVTDLYNFTLEGQDSYTIPAADLVTGTNTITFTVTNQFFYNGTQYLNPAGLMYKLSYVQNCANANNAPVADAGDNQIITLPTNSVNLDASGSTDSDGSISSYVWSFVSGPSNINPDDTVSPSVTGLVEGTYVFELTVTDNDGATDTDTVSITVNPASGGGHTPECSDGVDNSDAEDTLVDANDPGCHSDGNVNNSDSYVPSDDSESNENAQCSDGLDNDADQLIDSQDPGCHTDGDASNDGSWDKNDNDETDDGIGGDDVLPQCSDGIDNDADGFIDYPADPGCNSPQDDNETNGGGGGHHHGGGGGSTPVGQVLGTSTSCGIYVEKYLRVGYKNDVETVQKVQVFLNNYQHAGLIVDGIYGVKTEAAVRTFQLARFDKVLLPWNIDHQSTGIFYLTTQTEVNNIMCPTLNLPIPANLINFSSNSSTPPVIHTVSHSTGVKI